MSTPAPSSSSLLSSVLQSISSASQSGVGVPSGSELQWVFVSGDTLPFLQWVTTHLSTANVVSKRDLSEFSKIPSSSVLHGEELRQSLAVAALAGGSLQPGDNLQGLEEQLSSGSQQLARLQHRVAQLRARREHLGGAVQASAQTTSLCGAMHRHFRPSRANKVGDEQVEEVVGNVVENATVLVSMHKEQPRFVDTMEPLLACHLNLSPFTQVDSMFTRQMKEFLLKHFQVVPPSVELQSKKGNQYEWLEVTEPPYLLLFGETSWVHSRHSQEIIRLQEAYRVSSLQHVRALSQKAYAVGYKESQPLKSTKLDKETMRHYIAESQKRIEMLKQSSAALQQDVRKLITKASNLRHSQLLLNDAKFKIARERNRSVNQDRVISYLLYQSVWHKLFKYFLQQEQTLYTSIASLMSGLANELNELFKKQLGRLENSRYQQAEFTSSARDELQLFLLQLLRGRGSISPQTSMHQLSTNIPNHCMKQLHHQVSVEVDLLEAERKALSEVSHNLHYLSLALCPNPLELTLTAQIFVAKFSGLENSLKEMGDTLGKIIQERDKEVKVRPSNESS